MYPPACPRIEPHSGSMSATPHSALVAVNPLYATLVIMQKPSWVRPPSYKSSGVSSLVVTFEDPDSSSPKTLLTERYLYAIGTGAKVKKWKQHVKRYKKPPEDTASQPQGEKSDDEVAITPTPPAQSKSRQQPLNKPAQSSTSTTTSATQDYTIPPRRTRAKKTLKANNDTRRTERVRCRTLSRQRAPNSLQQPSGITTSCSSSMQPVHRDDGSETNGVDCRIVRTQITLGISL